MQNVLETLQGIFPPSVHNKVFIVGGLVRDHLIGPLTGKLDVDLVAQLPPEQILKMNAIPVKAKSAAPVFLLRHETLGDIQIALPRKETKTGYGYHGFEYQYDHCLPIETDLGRRDFTVNAIAMSFKGEVIDPYGGRDHLPKKELHHISDSFRQDPVRVFRAYHVLRTGIQPVGKHPQLHQGNRLYCRFR